MNLLISIILCIDTIIDNITIVKRIQKLGNYAGTVQILVKMLLDAAIYRFKYTIKFTKVSYLSFYDRIIII